MTIGRRYIIIDWKAQLVSIDIVVKDIDVD